MVNDDRPIAAWEIHGRAVIIADNADIWNYYLPDQRYGLLVKKALDTLDADTTPPSGIVTISNLAFHVRPAVVPNGDCKPQWAVHRRHQTIDLPCETKLSPFIMMSRDVSPPVTSELTVHFSNNVDHPVIDRLYPGSPIPPLPWEEQIDDLGTSVTFWNTHSFIYGVQYLTAIPKGSSVQWYNPPSWFVNG